MTKQLSCRKRFYLPPIVFLLVMYILSIYSMNMKTKFVYGICPAFIIYTDTLTNKKSAGETRGLIVLIRPNLRNNKIIEKHELIHVKQSYRTLFFGWIPVLIDQHVYADLETEAYASQINNPNEIDILAEIIKEEYDFDDVSLEYIKEKLWYYYNET